MRSALALLVLGTCVAPTEAIWSYGPESFNCKMRALAYEYGKKSLPVYGQFESLYYALGLNKDCTDYIKPPTFNATDLRPVPPMYTTKDADQIFVDYTHGSDSNSGDITHPLRTINAAVKLAEGRVATVNLRAGTHYLTETVQITPDNNGLTIQNYNGELVEVSGGKRFDVDWKPYKVSDTENMYVSDVTGITSMPGFQMDGVRATRARFPNGNVELPERSEESGNPEGVQMIKGASGKWTAPDLSQQGKQQYVTNTNPEQMRNFTTYGFQEYMVGIGGPCDIYDPPVAYWCASGTKGGGAFPFRVPRGVAPISSAIAPAGGGPDSGLHLPYKTTEGMIFNVWRPARWANWMFEVADYDAATNNFTFGKGGFQGARGNNAGGDFFVENVFEEFDYPNEFFFDAAASKVYYYHNATGAPSNNATYVAPQLKTLFNLTAESRWTPIKNVTIRGLKMSATRYTYMEPHGVPSGGDWALDRMGAVFLQGTEGCTVDGNFMTRLDGNAVVCKTMTGK